MKTAELFQTYFEVCKAMKWTSVRTTYVMLLNYRLELEAQIEALQF